MTYIAIDEQGPDEFIDVDIDVYDDNCVSPGLTCEEIEFEDEEDDGDDIFDFDGDVLTSCTLEGISYDWTFQRNGSSQEYRFTSEFIEDFAFLEPGVWTITLRARDACGQSGAESMTYIVADDSNYSLDVTILADPIYGYEDLEVAFNGIVNGGVAPYIYNWNF
jgi:hypothetical protein